MASELKILGYAAADQAVEDIVRRRWPHVAEAWPTKPGRTIVRENTFGEFSGVQPDTLPFRDGVRVEVFQGIVRGVLAGHLAHDDAKGESRAGRTTWPVFTSNDPDHVQRCGFLKN